MSVRYVPLLLALAALAGCGGEKLQSRWLDREVVVDGQDTEWDNARYWLKDSRAGLGLMNDDAFLYISVSMADPELQAQIMRQGFTVWLDARGGRKETVGLRFPLGMMERNGGGPPSGDGPPEEVTERSRGSMPPRMNRTGPPDAQELQAMFERMAHAPEMLLLGPRARQQRRVATSDTSVVLLRTSYAKGRLVYEVRVPLALAFLGTPPGPVLGLGFETQEMDQAAPRRRAGGRSGGPPGGGPGGGMGGGMPGGGMPGGGGPGGGGPGGPMGMSAPEQFRLWTKVLLAASPGA